MLVALLIMSGVGMILIVIAGQSKNAGNAVALLLTILLVEQGITHVNPLAEFLVKHPLTPPQAAPIKNTPTPGFGGTTGGFKIQ
jgi:hypothetical protein